MNRDGKPHDDASCTAKVGTREAEPKTDKDRGVDDHASDNPPDTDSLELRKDEIQNKPPCSHGRHKQESPAAPT
jgi:hypothetical protein